MNICVASGKGGTGKTTIAVSLARVARGGAYVDCDVEEPNGHLFLRPNITKHREVMRSVARVDLERCTFCGDCVDACVYNAIAVAAQTERALVFDDLCVGCGVCSHVCPEDAINEIDVRAGEVNAGFADRVPFLEGRMDTNAPHAHWTLEAALEDLPNAQTVVIDAEPGVTGRVIDTVRHSDVVLLVTEPTPSGLHDLELALDMVKLTDLPVAAIINRSNLGEAGVAELCEERGVPIIMEIPFDRRIAAGYAVGKALVDIRPELIEPFRDVLARLTSLADGEVA